MWTKYFWRKSKSTTTMLVPVLIVACFHLSSSTQVTFHILEESPINKLIGNVGSASGIVQDIPAGAFTDLVYSSIGSHELSNLIKLNKQNGNIYTSEIIDRESVCGWRKDCIIKTKIALYSSKFNIFEIIDVSIFIDDINDHDPKFHPQSMRIEISESSAVGTTIANFVASDSDSTQPNRVNDYKLGNENEHFDIHVIKENDGSATASCVLKKQLNRETQYAYKLRVLAMDGGKPTRSGYSTLDIVVIDENDNTPLFEHDFYFVTVQENVTVGTVIEKVVAFDSDTGENGKVSYKIAEDFNNYGQFIEVSESTGEIKVKGSLDRITGDTLRILIEAVDHGKPPRATRVNLTISVLDVVNNAPFVDIDIMSPTSNIQTDEGHYRAAVAESASLGSVVAYVTVQDRDSGENGIVTCSISDYSFVLKKVPSRGYIILTNESLDREIKDNYRITLTCKDKGEPSLVTSVDINIVIADVNDNPPVFTTTSHFISLEENNNPGEHLLTLTATDKDTERNAKIKYLIQEEDNNFDLDPISGYLRTSVKFDREFKSEYHVTVIAVDSGFPALTATATVLITILDINDNAPKFKVPIFQYFVLENMPEGIKVGQLKATDSDSGINKNVLYSIGSGFKNTVPFMVFQDGSIKTTEKLDREEREKYRFQVKAYDLGSPSKSCIAEVIIHVADDNDNAPKFLFSLKENETVSISSETNVGDVVTVIKAQDIDARGPNSRLQFSIIGGNDLDLFVLDKHSGVITLQKSPENQDDKHHILTIRVSDSGYNSLSVNRKIHIIFRHDVALQSTSVIGARNAMLTTAIVTVTVIVAAAILTVLCIIRRNTIKKKRAKALEDEKAVQIVPLNSINIYESRRLPASQGTCTENEMFNQKSKVHDSEVTDNEDLDNMELYNSTGTSMFTNTLIESKKMVTTDEDSDDSDCGTNCDSGKGGSYLDVYKLNRMKTLMYFGPSQQRIQPPINRVDVMDVI